MAVNIEEIKKLQEEALKKLPEQIASKTVKSLDEDEVLTKYKLALEELRKDGVNKIVSLKQEIAAARKNRMLEKPSMKKLLSDAKNKLPLQKRLRLAIKLLTRLLQKKPLPMQTKFLKHT